MVMERLLKRWSNCQFSYLALWTTVDVVLIFVFRTENYGRGGQASSPHTRVGVDLIFVFRTENC